MNFIEGNEVLLVVPIAWAIGSFVGWLFSRQTLSRDRKAPFNWRVFISPWTYLRWLDK